MLLGFLGLDSAKELFPNILEENLTLFLFISILFTCRLFTQYMRRVEYYILDFRLPRICIENVYFCMFSQD